VIDMVGGLVYEIARRRRELVHINPSPRIALAELLAAE
jgi:hypothetical protein